MIFHIKASQTQNKSQGHKRSAERQKAMAAPGTNPAEKALQTMNEQHFEKMRILFRVAHSIAKKSRPFKDYTWILDLHEATHGISLGEIYRNDKGSTDSSVREAEIMYVRYSDKENISNKFLALKNIPHANAENLTQLIENTLKEYRGFTDANLYEKMVGFGADGTSVNMGCHNGIGARLK